MSGRLQHDFTGRPRLLIAYTDPAYASECGRYFRRLGWEVEMVASGVDACELAQAYRPNVVVLDAELLDESGWLTSANNAFRIVVATESDDRACEFPSVRRRDGAEALAMTILGPASLSHAV
jgi:ActR/RegA family two-component response regulator